MAACQSASSGSSGDKSLPAATLPMPAAASLTIILGTSDALDNIRIGREDSYKEFSKIGTGAFDDMWKVRHHHSGKQVAIKSMRANGESLLHEAVLLAVCAGNPTMVDFQEVVRGAKMDKLYIIKEYTGRSLHCVMGMLLHID
jgi:serine/threonine protein kinase